MLGFDPKEAKKHSIQRNAGKDVAQKKTAPAVPDKVAAMNQAPDTVPIMAKPGEYVLPVDTVHALGGAQQLDSVVDATHTPAPEAAVVPEGQQPQFFFSNGGQVPEEDRRRLVQVPASMQRRENTTFAPDNSIATPAPTVQPAAPATPAAAPPAVSASASPKQTSPSNIYPQSSPSAGAPIYQGAGFKADDFGSSGKLASVPSSIGQQPGRQPAPQYPAPKYPANYTGPKAETASVAAPAATARATNQPLDAQAAADRAKIGAAWDTVKDVNDDAGRAIADVAMMVPRGLAGAYDSAVIRPMRAFGIDAGYLSPHLVPKGVDPASMTPFTDQKRMQQQVPAASTEAAPAPVAGFGPTASRAPGSPPPAIGTADPKRASTAAPPAAPVQSSTTAANPTQLPAGVYQHGRGQYSDSAQGMGFSPGFTGRPNAQNLEAASNLSAQSQRESMGRVASAMAQPQAAGFRAPTVNHSGNDWTTREMLRRAKMDATSLMNRTGKQRRQAEAAYQQAAAADMAAMTSGQANADIKAMGFNADLAREQLQQDGALQRTLIGQSSDAARLGLEERRLAGEETARGFQVRQGQRLEQAQTAYLNAKTPEEQASALATMRALSGKGEGSLKDNYMSLGGGQEWDPQANTMRNVPQRLIDLRTGQEVGGNSRPVGPATPRTKAEYDALPKGAEYIRDGKTFIKS